jgi:hypothetical protein
MKKVKTKKVKNKVTEDVLLHEYAGISQQMEEYKKELEKEYGAISIDLETGEYTEIESSEEVKQ